MEVFGTGNRYCFNLYFVNRCYGNVFTGNITVIVVVRMVTVESFLRKS